MCVLFRLLLNVVMKEEGVKEWGESAAMMKPSNNTTHSWQTEEKSEDEFQPVLQLPCVPLQG